MIVPCSPVLDVTFFWDGFLKEDRDSPPPPQNKMHLWPQTMSKGRKQTCKKTSTMIASQIQDWNSQCSFRCVTTHNPHIFIDPGSWVITYIFGGIKLPMQICGDFDGPTSPYLLGGSPSDRWNLWGECLKAFEEKQKTRWGWKQQKTKGTRVEFVRPIEKPGIESVSCFGHLHVFDCFLFWLKRHIVF